ncbi:TlpA family protein disulfide reductase [bacterium]|nr:MAG: TlpA family protein disulfide reductase [bacterium]
MGTLKRFAPIFATLAVAATSAYAAAEPGELAPGAPAPELSIKRWVKGNPVKEFDKDKIYVVEFWATWCGPCKTSIPHLSELAKKNTDVTFIGVGIWEEDEGDNIDKFVKDMGDKMSYNVAYSGNKDGMAASWMEPFGQNGIPSSFIVKQGKVQWVGHPMSMDKPLEEIKAGTFDLEGFKADFEKKAAKTRAQMAINKEVKDLKTQFDEGKRDEAKLALARLVGKNPDFAPSAESIRFEWLAIENPAAWETKAKEMVATKEAPKIMQVASFALGKAQKPEGYELARKAIGIALDGTERKDINVLWYSAHVYKATGDNKLAVDSLTKAIEVFPTSEAKDAPELKTAMEKMKKDLEAKLATTAAG